MTEEQPRLVGREFVHFKGGHYRLEGFAAHREANTPSEASAERLKKLLEQMA